MFKPLKIILVILPLLYLVLTLHQQSSRTNYHMYDTDPEYAYLFNGMNICNLKSPSHVIGPGTPLQALSALVIKVVHTFRSTPDSLNVDVMKNPDVYCIAINTSILFLISISVFLAGIAIAFATKNIFTGMFFQLIPFTKWVLLDLASKIMVEGMIISCLVLLMAFVILFIHDDSDNRQKWFDKYVLGFSILIGLIASLKFVYLPIAILPFLLLQGAKQKLSYTVTTIVVFFILSFPILFHWVAFRDWYIDNFFHSGMYGSGKATIIDPEVFRNNLREIFLKNRFYFINFIASAVLLPLYYIPFFKLKRKNDKEFYAFLGIFITLIVLTFLVSKQFKEYYLTVNYLLIVPGWYFIIRILSRIAPPAAFRYIQIAAFVILAYFVWNNGPKLLLDYHTIRVNRDEMFRESLEYAEHNFDSNTPTLVLANYYGAPFKEYGLYFGIAWCGPKMGNIYARDLNKLYPHIYFFHGWNNLFNQWGTSYSYIDLLKKYGEVVFYSGDQVWEASLSHQLKGINRQLDTKWEVLKAFDQIGQTFYSVKYDSIAANISPYVCDAESIDSSGIYFVNELGQMFEGASYRNTDYSRSGTQSVKLIKDQPGFTCTLSEVQKGDQYLIEVWRKNENPNSELVVISENEQEVLFISSSATITEGEWEKLSISFTVPEKFHNKGLKIYCRNLDEEKTACFDDLVISRVFGN